MSSTVVSAEGISKQYTLGQLQGGYGLFTESISQRLRSVRTRPPRREEFWALRGIDFEVERGEKFAIVGHNGAGKSTLLKILSRVTPPTSGEITLRGRVGALLEVGTGFHPELTGRENVFLNGAILGMRRTEIQRKFDEIVEFAEVERFIDTPVKRYSSGMQLRLAFAVAAHLEPEVLIIDEVLSVGDLAFQEKCLGRMQEVSGEGRTVLFVSHNLTAVQTLCARAMLLSHGEKVAEGPTADVIDEYVRTAQRDAGAVLSEREDRQGTGDLRFLRAYYESDGKPIDSPATGQNFEVVVEYATRDGKPLRNVSFAVQVLTMLGDVMLHLYTKTAGVAMPNVPGRGTLRCAIPRCPLPAGEYTITLWSDLLGEPLDWIQRAVPLTVHEGDFFGSGQAQVPTHQSVLIDHAWSIAGAEGSEAVALEAGKRR